MTCLPLVLCLAVSGGFLLSNVGLRKSADTAVPETIHGAAGEGVPDGAAVFLGSVEVTGGGLSHEYTLAEDVEGIISCIEDIKELPEQHIISEPAGFITWSGDSSIAYHSGCGGYEIRIKDQYGTSTAYKLTGSALTDLTTGKTYYMDEDTCSRLKKLLGIPLS